MASCSEKDLTCPVCHEIFKDPVVLTCSHSFCKVCVQTWWREKQINECPVCKERPLLSNPPVSLALKNLCEAFLRDQKGSEDLCSVHFEKLKLFCLDHQKPACVVCRDSRTHTNHRFRPIDEASQDCKEEIQKSLRPLREKLKLCEEVKGKCDQTAKHIKVQTRNTEKQIREHFKQIHQFLQREEELRIAALREEEKQKSKLMMQNTEAVSRAMAAISETIRATEKELRSADVPFLLNNKDTLKKLQQRLLMDDPKLASGALIDEAKHLGNLNFNIWNKMKEMASYSPVILDPNTAHPELMLSEDLSCMRSEKRQKLPDNPERFDFSRAALGSEGFTSGAHSWEVEVGDNTSCDLGVAAESVSRKGCIQSGLWRIGLSDGKFEAVSPSEYTKLHLKTLRRIRVHLDWKTRQLSFSDAETDSLIFIFTDNFTEKLFPYFRKNKAQQFKILPKKVSVTVN